MAVEVKEMALYDVKQVAQFFGITERTARRWCREGKLPALKVRGGRRWYVYGRDLLALELAQCACLECECVL